MVSAEAGAESPMSGVVGVVLAGGGSRRMGRDKAALLLGGEPLLRRTVGRLRLALAEVIVVGSPALAPLVPDTPLVPDAWPGRGPLGALATAFSATDAPWVALVACDMPFIQPALIREIARRALASHDIDAVTLRGARGAEPLHSAYSRACLPLALERLATDDASLRGLLALARVAEVSPSEARLLDPAGRSTFNANTPEEWQTALRIAKAENARP
jgi:molybdopterin-guanine dinucleotide biosynthesis protein A